MKVALTGDVALELVAPYFRQAGHEVYVPAGFGAWRQELLDPASPLHAFAPDSIFDVTAHDGVLAGEVPGFYDERMRRLASMPYSLDGIHAIVEEFEFQRLAAPKKILAVDADNTLWRGILSEDGKDALIEFRAFQQALKELRDDGAILVLLTKNDPSENFMRRDMTLADGDFAVRKIDWSPKPGNLLAACEELNLPPESVVFVDDNPHERAQMSAHLPEVAVPPFPADMAAPAQFMRRLREYFFSGIGKTLEDRLRAADYANRAAARKALAGAATLDDYLGGLGLRAAPSIATREDIERLAQMAGKTNQFNATTIRRTKDDFAALLGDPKKKIFVFRAEDRFGPQGIVCYIVADLAARRITDFVMSCRAMGRTLEYFAYAFASRELGYKPAIDFAPTPKNAPFKRFLDSGAQGKTFYTEIAPLRSHAAPPEKSPDRAAPL